MADICMCTGNCPIREKCYRYMATPNPYGQSYSYLEDICIPDNYSEFIPFRNGIAAEEAEINIDYTLADFLLEEIHKTMDFD